MKTPPRKKHDPTGSPAKGRGGAPEAAESKETFPPRPQAPGEAGLGNEARPGLGTRRDEPFPGEPGAEPHRPAKKGQEDDTVAQRQHSSSEPNDKPLPREPREQGPDTWEHEEERSTGVSGHMGGS